MEYAICHWFYIGNKIVGGSKTLRGLFGIKQTGKPGP